MKKIKFLAILSVSLLMIAGCDKEDVDEAPFDLVKADESQLKINYASAYPTNPQVQLSIDDVRLSTLITGRTPYPGGGYNTGGSNHGLYFALKAGQRKLTIAIPKRNTNVDSVVLYSTTFELDSNKNHTLHVMDTFANTKSLLVEDAIVRIPGNGIKYRFVNLMPNVPNLELYFGGIKVASASYNTPGETFTMPMGTASMAWTIREPGSATNLATYTSGNTVINRRTYTAFAMGYKGSSATATRPYISFLLNQ